MNRKQYLSVKLQWLSLIAIGFGYSMIYLDMTALNVALPYIQNDLGASNTELYWIINAYLLGVSVFCLSGGRLGDILGVRSCYLVGLFIFAIASIGCAFSNSVATLIIYRSFQGLGAAICLPIAQAALYHIFPDNRRGKALGLFGVSGILFIMVGPTIGGVFTQYSTWRWVFGINPILGLVSFGMVWILLKGLKQEKESGVKFDYVGQLLILGALVPLVMAIMQGQTWGWSSALIISLFCTGSVFLLAFIFFERSKKHPLVEIQLFKKNEFSISNFIFFVMQFGFICNVFFALYLEKALNFSPLDAGVALLPIASLSLIANPIAGHLVDKIGAKIVLRTGLLIQITAYLWIAFMAQFQFYPYLLITLILLSIGGPFAFLGNFMRFMNSVSKTKQGMAAGIGMTTRQIGGVLGVAVISMVILFFENKYLNILKPQASFTKGFSVAMFIVALLLIISLFLSFFMEKKGKRLKELPIQDQS